MYIELVCFQVNVFGEGRLGANVDVTVRKLILDQGSTEGEFSDGINYFIDNLPLETSVQFKVTTSNGSTRTFYIFR